jgi:hypothetical protein
MKGVSDMDFFFSFGVFMAGLGVLLAGLGVLLGMAVKAGNKKKE